MSDRTRYQAQSVYQEQAGVTSYSGVDPVTGLPVLIYRFNGKADPALARLDSEHLPRLLAWRDDDTTGIMVVAWSSAWQPAQGQPLDGRQLLESAQVLADAAAAGVHHGDLNSGRFLLAGDSIVLEGFGVPWNGSAPGSGTTDVRAWAEAVLELGHLADPRVDGLLDSITAGDGTEPGQLPGRLAELLEPEQEETEAAPAEAAEDASYSQLELSWDDPADLAGAFSDESDGLPAGLQMELDFEPGPAGPEPEDPATADQGTARDDAVFTPSQTFASELLTSRSTVQAVPDATHAEAQQETAAAAAPVSHSSLPAGGSSSFVKRIGDGSGAPARTSVGTTGLNSGSGRSESRRPARDDFDPSPAPADVRSPRRIIMIVVLLILSAVLVTLVLYLRRSDVESVPAGIPAGVTYVIDVLVEPDNLPPVNLYVLESPAASQLRPNTILGTAPRRMALDAEGTWVFEGRFQGRVSEPVTIRIPEERSSTVTITIPAETEAAD